MNIQKDIVEVIDIENAGYILHTVEEFIQLDRQSFNVNYYLFSCVLLTNFFHLVITLSCNYQFPIYHQLAKI